MSIKNNIPYDKAIYNFILTLRLTLYFTKPQIKHVCEFIFSASNRSYSGKLTQISEICYSTTHKSSISRFLSKSTWNEDYISKVIKKFTIDRIWTKSLETGLPIHVIIDDTICKKTKPSSRAKNPIENGGFHHSHTENKLVYGHQIVGVLLKCDDLTLPLDFILFEKNQTDFKGNKISKITQAIDIINSLPKPPNEGYIMADSWYSAEKIIKASIKSGFNYLGALKTNRVIYPKQYRMNQKISGFAKKLSKDDFDLVTVKGHEYYVYRYQGKINGFDNITIILSYPKSAFQEDNALKAFVTTNSQLTTIEILNLYTTRWTIEIFFRQNKMQLGFDNYQVRTKKAFKRFLLMTQLSYIYLSLSPDMKSHSISKGIEINRIKNEVNKVDWILSCVQEGASRSDILNALKLPQDKCA